MSKLWEITRGEAEFLVDVLEALPPEKQYTGMEFLGAETALDLASELRKLFGMRTRADSKAALEGQVPL